MSRRSEIVAGDSAAAVAGVATASVVSGSLAGSAVAAPPDFSDFRFSFAACFSSFLAAFSSAAACFCSSFCSSILDSERCFQNMGITHVSTSSQFPASPSRALSPQLLFSPVSPAPFFLQPLALSQLEPSR